jgi:hypothetical protein
VAQTFAHAAAPGPLDPLERWRIADRLARQAETRVPPDRVALRQAGRPSPLLDQALALRRQANELLRAALGDLAPAGRDSGQAAQALGA